MEGLVQFIQFVGIFRTQVDSELRFGSDRIDGRTAGDGADIVRRLRLGRYRQPIETADEAGRFGNGIGLAEMHPAVAAGSFDRHGIAPGSDGSRHEGIESTVDGDDFGNPVVPIGHDLPHPLEIAQAFFADIEGEK